MNDHPRPEPPETEHDTLFPEELPEKPINDDDIYLDPFNDDPLHRYGERRKESPFADAVPKPDKAKERKRLILLVILGGLLGYPFYPVLTAAIHNFLGFLLGSVMLNIFFILVTIAVPILITIKFAHYCLTISNNDTGGNFQKKMLLTYIPFELLTLGSMGIPNKYASLTLMALAVVPIVAVCIIGNKATKKLLLPLMIILLSLTAANNIYLKMVETNIPFEAEYIVLTPHAYGIGTESCQYITTDCDPNDYMINEITLSTPEQFEFAFYEHESDNNPYRVVNYIGSEEDNDHTFALLVGNAISHSSLKYDASFFNKYDLLVRCYYPQYPITHFQLTSITKTTTNTIFTPEYTYTDAPGSDEHPYSEAVIALIRTKKSDTPNV